MFIGEFEHTVDEKGRLAIPAKFRGKVADGLVVTYGIDKCLFVFTNAAWDTLAEKISKLPMTNSNARRFQRFMFSGATPCQPDSQGRIVLPASLRAYAGINNEAVVIGVTTRMEIWARNRWQEVKYQLESENEAIAEQLQDLGI